MAATCRPTLQEVMSLPIVLAEAYMTRLPKLDDGTSRSIAAFFEGLRVKR